MNHRPSISVHTDDPAPLVASSDNARTDPAVYRRLFGLLVAQARRDGMDRLRLQADPHTRTIQLFYGRTGPAEVEQWWEMTQPPCEAYSNFVAAIVACAVFDDGALPSGKLTVTADETPIHTTITLARWSEFRAVWTL